MQRNHQMGVNRVLFFFIYKSLLNFCMNFYFSCPLSSFHINVMVMNKMESGSLKTLLSIQIVCTDLQFGLQGLHPL